MPTGPHAPGNYVLVLNQPGANAWPITGATFILVYKDQPNAAKAAAVLKFFDYGYKDGDFNASDLFYVPLPAAVKSMVRKAVGRQRHLERRTGLRVAEPLIRDLPPHRGEVRA
ncbi:MAG: hypothetical protein WDN06_13805 [Asticcacaulis sp.]